MTQWTEQQQKAIGTRGNLLVSAGAGSGKTAVMIERICSLLRQGEDLRNMVVCTFTKTAAVDMKRKLAESLLQSSDPWLREQLSRLASAEISTLHAWCAHLIKSWFFYGDLDPEFSVLEEGEAWALKSEAAEEVIAAQKAAGDEAFAGLYAAFLGNRSHKRLKTTLLSVYDYACAQPDPHEWLRRSAAHDDAYYRDVLQQNAAAQSRQIAARAEELLQAHAAASFALDTDALLSLKACAEREVACTAVTPTLRNKPQFKDLHERFKELKSRYTALCRRREEIAALPRHEDSEIYARALGDLALRLDEVYTANKRSRGKADYADLEHQALKILRAHGDEIVPAYKYVFVDEYQDISPLQEEILSLFTGEMFFVGDVKQSIYGFRMCRPQFFLRKREAYRSGGGTALELTANFRSGGKVLDAVNEVFSAVMTREFGGTDYGAERLTAGRMLSASVKAVLVDPPPESEAPVPAVYSVQNDTRPRVNGGAEAEADAVVREIIDLLDGTVPDGEGERDTDYGDIAVLVRSRGPFTDLLERKLRAESIPVSTVAADSAAESFVSVSVLLSLLRLLDNARDDVNLAAVMLSPPFGRFTADELAALRIGRDGSFYDCVFGEARAQDEALERKRAAFAEKIARWRHDAAETTVAELAGRITAQSDCFAYASAAGGEREAAALDAFLEHLAAQTEHDTLHEYLRYIGRAGTPRLKVQDGGRAVRIMTIHASKGLEFPCVILPQLHKSFNLRDTYANVICDEQEGIVLRSFDFTERTVTENPRFVVCAERLRRTLAQEELRILYVAMTRAQYKLCLFAQKPNGADDEEETWDGEEANSFLGWLYPFMAKIAVPQSDEPREERPVRSPQRPDEKIVRALGKRFARVYPYARGGTVKASVSGVVHREDDEGERLPVLIASDDRAAERGSAYHKFMQWVRFGKTGEWERLCERFPAEGALADKDQIERAFATVGDWIGGRTFVREKAFVYNAPARETGEDRDGNVLVQGVIDLLVFNADGSAEIVDYKTGKEEHLHSPAYVRQLNLYARAVQKILGKRVAGAYLYGFFTGKMYPVPLESPENTR